MSLPLVFGAFGAIIGSFFGMPALGFELGSVVGGLIFGNGNLTIQGPQLKELSVTTSGYGNSIPIAYGTIRLSGQIIWLKGNKLDQSSFGVTEGGQTIINYTYSATFAVAFCEGPAGSLLRIWMNRQLVYDATASSSTGGSGGSTVFAEWTPNTTYVLYNWIIDSNGNVQVATPINPNLPMVSGASQPTWATPPPLVTVTADTGVNLNWNLSTPPGIWAPSTFYSFFECIIDPNGNAQLDISLVPGFSSSGPRNWATNVGGKTSDGDNLTWLCLGGATQSTSGGGSGTGAVNNPQHIQFAFYPGDDLQMPDPDIQADEGATITPAFRGLCYIKFLALQLTAITFAGETPQALPYNNSIPNVEVELAMISEFAQPTIQFAFGLPIVSAGNFNVHSIAPRAYAMDNSGNTTINDTTTGQLLLSLAGGWSLSTPQSDASGNLYVVNYNNSIRTGANTSVTIADAISGAIKYSSFALGYGFIVNQAAPWVHPILGDRPPPH